MSSKTIDSSTVRQYQLHLIMSEQSQSIANNTTTIAYELRLTSGNYNFQQYGAGWAVWINGTRVAYHDRNTSDRYSISKNSSWTIASGTTTVTHNTDGTKTITCSASLDMAGDPAPGALSCQSASWTLTTIPRASSMTLPSSFTIGSSGSITIQMASNTFSHTITYSGYGLSGTVANLNAGVSSTSWTPPTSFYAKLPNSTSGTVTLTLTTKSGATTVGTATYNTTINVPSSIKPTAPTVTLAPVNTNAWISSKGIYVGGYSAVKVTSSATAGSGATMSSYTISGAFSGSGTPYTSGVLSAGAKSITVTATDSRGRTNSTTTSVTFLTYTYPGLTTFTALRGTYSGGSWTSNVNGNHIRVEAVPSVALSANGNTASVTVKIGNTNPSATSGNYYYFTSTTATQSYTITGTVSDSVGNTTSRTLTVPTIEVPLNINVDLPGIGVGMIAQTAHQFEVAPAWSLVANGRNNTFGYMPYSTIISGSGSDGYLRIASIQADTTWTYGSIVFDVQRLYDSMPVRLGLYFETGSGTTPTNVSLRYERYNGTYVSRAFNAFVVQTGDVLDVYIYKCTTGSERVIVRTYQSASQATHSYITYPGGQMASIPSGAKVAEIAPCLNPTVTITKTGGNSTASGVKFYRSGNVCHLAFNLATSAATSAGSNVFTGTTDAPVPVYATTNASYYGSTTLVTAFDSSGLVVRVEGASLASGSNAFCNVVYLTNA